MVTALSCRLHILELFSALAAFKTVESEAAAIEGRGGSCTFKCRPGLKEQSAEWH